MQSKYIACIYALYRYYTKAMKYFYLLLFTFFLSSPHNARALSCMEPSLERSVRNNSFVVHGRVEKVVLQNEPRSNSGPDKYRFRIIEMLKGKTEDEVLDLEVGTWMGNPRFKVGDERIVFSRSTTPLSTGPCAVNFKGNSIPGVLPEIRALINHKGLGLPANVRAPNIHAAKVGGGRFHLSDETKTTILVFYRGSWCPYCIKQLVSIEKEVIGELGKANAQLVAISVDRIEVAERMQKKNGFSFIVLSDSQATSLQDYRIANTLTPSLVKKYKNAFKIDVEADSGEKHHMVAHPAVFVVKDGKIIFADVHENYKERTDNKDILAAIREN